MITLFNDGPQTRAIAKNIGLIKPEDGDTRYVQGRGIVFNEWTELIPGRVRERVLPEVRNSDVWESDIHCCIDHDPKRILGRTSNGTMSIDFKDDGVYYRSEIPPTSYGKDFMIHMERNNVYGSSFTFMPVKDGGFEIERNEDDGYIEVTHKRFAFIKDISPVFTPAYKQTSVQMRNQIQKNLEEYEKALLDHDAETYMTIARAKFEILKITDFNY